MTAAEWEWLDDLLRFRNRNAANARCVRLTTQTGLCWQAEYHNDTARWHVVLSPEQVHHVTPRSAS